MLGWISSLLLVALGGCRAPSLAPDLPSTFAAAQSKANARVSPPLVSAGNLPVPPVANRDTSGAERPSESVQTVRMVSLRSDRSADTIRPLSLEDAINLSLDGNPDLVAMRAAGPVARAAFQVAKVYPYNPQFQTQVLPYSRDRDGNDGAVAQQHVIVQTFELGGQRRFRKGAAAASWRQVNRTIHQAELMNAAQTTRLFFAALYQRELRDLEQSLAEMNEQFLGVVERREKAGLANNADVELARLQSQSSQSKHGLAEANYQTAILRLRTQLNVDVFTPLEPRGQWIGWQWQSIDHLIGGYLEPWSSMIDDHAQALGTASLMLDDAALRQLVVERPDVAAARSAVAMATENLRLANAMRHPNLQLGPMYQRDDAATTFWGVQAQFDIPVVNTGKPLVQQRYAELRQQQITATQLENRAVLEAGAAIERYERARQLVEQSRGDVAREISDSLRPFENQFKAGQITLLQVFAGRAALAQSRKGFFDLLNELTLAVADVTQATGLPPQQMIGDIESLPPTAPVEPLQP